MEKRRCLACGGLFDPRAQNPQQQYCSDPACQRERRRRWQRERLRADPDYRDNQARAQQRWRARHPEYWREYRRRHLEYVEGNRNAQRRRNRRRGVAEPPAATIAKMDASAGISPVPSGTYRLQAVDASGIAKMDAWTVRIAVLSEACAIRG
jgi:hypothetical protein